MIDDILDMARLEARRVRLEPRAISAETAVSAALAPVEAAAREKAIAVSVDVPCRGSSCWPTRRRSGRSSPTSCRTP
ncbi:hypothetical protein ACU4GR_11100 [Methylobacterium oryzae CBMB20]